MKKTLLLIACVLCLVLCACTPNNSETPDTTPAPTEPRPTPGLTVIAPSETPVEIIDPIDPSEGPVIVPVVTPAPTPEGTPVPTPENTPGGTLVPTPTPTPVPTPEATPEATPESTGDGIELPWIPVAPK